MDRAHDYTFKNRLGERVEDLRRRLEEVLGNINPYIEVSPPCIPLSSLFFNEEKKPVPIAAIAPSTIRFASYPGQVG